MTVPPATESSSPSQVLVRVCALDDAARANELRSAAAPFAQLEMLGDEVERAAARDPHGAVAAGEKLLATALQLAGPHLHGPLADGTQAARVLARLRRATTLALAYAGRLDESIALAELNRMEALAAGEAIEAARALLSAMHPLLKSGRTQQAIAAGESAHAEFLRASRPELAARADINLGNVRKSLGDSAETLRHLDRAKALLGSDASLAAHIENTRGEALLALDRFPEARQAFTSALDWATRSAAGFAVGVIEGNLADLAARSGSLHEALELFARARSTITARGHSARLLLEEADVLLALGLAPFASERLREALAIVDDAGLAFEGLRASLALSRARAALGDLEDARGLAASAAERAAMLHDAPSEARAHSMRALLLAEQGSPVEAGKAIELAEAKHPSPAPSDAVARLLIRSAIALRQLQPSQAAQYARAAAALATGIGAAPLEADAYVQLARLQRLAADHSGAIASASTAVAASERVRSALGAEMLRRAYLGRSVDSHEELVLAHLGHGGTNSPARALEAAERGKGRSLIERALAAHDAPRFQSGRREPDAGQDAAARGLTQVRGQLEAAYRMMGRDGDPGQANQSQRVAQLEAQLSRLEVDAATSGDHPTAVRWEARAERIQAALANDEALVEYYRAAGEWLAFVVTPDSVRAIKLGVPNSSITDAIARLSFQVRKALRDSRAGRNPQPELAMHALSALGGALWQPIAESHDLPSRLIIVPHGPLHAVPFSALRFSNLWLIDRHETSVLPSAGLLPILASTRNGGAPRHVAADAALEKFLVVGVADAHAPAIRDEAIAVASALATDPLLDDQATAAAVAEHLQCATLAHLACHGQFLPEAPWSSGLRLADRWFGARDVYSLTRSPREVVLSGCDTGGLDVLAGDELTGLVHALLARGTHAVVASLWSANDASTARTMLDLYAHASTVGEPLRIRPRALRAAQLAERDRSLHPAFWAPFTFTGVHQ